MTKFTELNLCPALQDNLAKHAFVQPTPVQAGSIPPAMAGKDVVATAQTGTGKTLAFALPLIERLVTNKTGKGKVRAVVLSPTRELAIQINDSFAKLVPGTGIRTAVVVGGMSENTQLRQIRGGADIIIATPGRLCDFLQRKLVDLSRTQAIVLDEADRMLDMGFLPSIKAILQTMPAQRQTMLFSATIETTVAHLISSYVKDPARVEIGSTTKPAEQVDLHTYEVEGARKLDLLVHLLNQEQGAFLVFARTKRGTDRLAQSLARAGVNAARIHGDRTQGQRNQALSGFKAGQFRVLVATDVAARGIHVDNIAHVVNYDLPQVPEDFVHRVGRTGRAGQRGVASTFSMRSERGDIRKIERALKVRMEQHEVPAGLAVAPSSALPVEERRQSERPSKVVVLHPKAKQRRPGFSSFAPRRRKVAGR